MKSIITASLLAASFVLPPLLVAAPAHAQAIVFDLGNVGYGYRDGYVDRDRRYHRWQNAQEARYYRSQYRDYYMYENYDRNRHRQPCRGR